MTFENSKYSKQIAYRKIELPFGNFYVTKQFIISELKEGIHVDHMVAGEIVTRFSEEIRKDIKIGYIANRINSYSFDPQVWVDFNNEYDFLVASAVVSYTDFSHLNSTIEKHFFSKSMKRCRSLSEAILWINNLDEFNQN